MRAATVVLILLNMILGVGLLAAARDGAPRAVGFSNCCLRRGPRSLLLLPMLLVRAELPDRQRLPGRLTKVGCQLFSRRLNG